MKKNLIVVLAAGLLISGCFKDDIHNNADATAVLAIVDGGPNNLASAPLGLAAYDSSIFYVNSGITSPYTLNEDVTVTLGVNDAARVAYNNSHTVQYDSLPDSVYSFIDTSAVLTAGARSINNVLTIYPSKADLTKNYMLAISIKNAQGIGVSSDLGTIYYNQVGSIIGGRYNITGTRTNYIGPVANGVISDTVDLSTIGTKLGVPVSKYVVVVDYSDLGVAGWQYIVTYDPDSQSISIVPNSVILNNATGVLNDSFKIDAQDYDPVTKTLHFKTEYMDESGNGRVVEETLTPQ